MLKSTLFFFICICTQYHVQAQERPHKIILGCSVNYLNGYLKSRNGPGINPSNFSTHQVGLHPNIGFKLDEHWMIGLGGGLSYSRGNGYDGFHQEEFTSISSAYSIGIFGRRYFGTNKPVQFFLEPNIGYTEFNFNSNFPKFTSYFTGTKKESKCIIAPGISWSVSKLFNLIARFGTLGYIWGENTAKDASYHIDYSYLGLRFSTDSFFIGAELKL